MSKKVKRILILVLVAAAVIGIFALAVNLLRRGKFPGVVDAWNGMVFSKTIEDFPDRMIDNLDEQTDTNFIVYAKKVRRVTAENGANRLVEADLEKLQYTFADPDEQLTELKRGDVFFIEPNEYNAYGLCVRVKKVRVKDGMAVITGKDVKLADLIEYADVEMDVPVTAFYLDNSEMTEDVQVQWVTDTTAEESPAVPMSADAQQGHAYPARYRLGEEPAETPVPTEQAAAQTAAAEPADKNVPFWLYELPLGEFDANPPKGAEVSTGINGDWDVLHAEGRAGVRISTVHVVFKVRPAMLTTVMSAQGDCRAFLNGSLQGQVGGSVPIKLPTIIIPFPPGPLVFTYTPSISLDFTASIGMSVELSAGVQFAAEANYMPVVNFVFRNGAFDIYDPSFTMNPVELEGRVDLNILQGEAEFGIPYVALLYGALSGGASLEGTGTAPGVFDEPEAEPDSYHECTYCVDGDVYLQTRLDVGVALDLVNLLHKRRGEETEIGSMVEFVGTPDDENKTATMTKKEGKIYRFGNSKSFRITDWSWSIIDLRWPFPIKGYEDFYISKRDKREYEFGWGECPHLLWRTDVTVKSTDGHKVSDALVTATDENGETRQAEVEKGKAVLYLPGGTSTLVCEKNILRDDCEVTINDAPAKADLTLEESRDLFIVLDFNETIRGDGDPYIVAQPLDTYPDVVQTLQERYPEAKIMTAAEWNWEPGPGTPTPLVEEHANKGLSLGDVVVSIDFFDPHNGSCKPESTTCDCGEGKAGVQFYELGVYIVLEHPDEYVTPRQQAFRYYQTYLHRYETYAEEVIDNRTYSAYWVTENCAEVFEHIPVGSFMDDEYQYNAEQAAENYTEYEISFPVGPMRTHDYGMRYAEFAEPITDYGLELLFPYVDELWYR